VTNGANANGTMRAFGRCLDLPHSYASDGHQLQLHDCNGTAAQALRPADGQIRTAPRCVAAAGNGTAKGP